MKDKKPAKQDWAIDNSLWDSNKILNLCILCQKTKDLKIRVDVISPTLLEEVRQFLILQMPNYDFPVITESPVGRNVKVFFNKSGSVLEFVVSNPFEEGV